MTILDPVLVIMSQMIPQTLVLTQDQVPPLIDVNRTNTIIKDTLDKFWSDLDEGLRGDTDPEDKDCPCLNCQQDGAFINVSVAELMWDGQCLRD